MIQIGKLKTNIKLFFILKSINLILSLKESFDTNFKVYLIHLANPDKNIIRGYLFNLY